MHIILNSASHADEEVTSLSEQGMNVLLVSESNTPPLAHFWLAEHHLCFKSKRSANQYS